MLLTCQEKVTDVPKFQSTPLTYINNIELDIEGFYKVSQDLFKLYMFIKCI